MKIVYFCTSEFGNPENSAILRELHGAHTILAVVTTPDSKVGRKQTLTQSPICRFANELEIPLLKPEKVKPNAEFLSQLKALHADLFIVVAYGKILPQELLELPRLKAINVHPSLLPKYRGPSPIPFAILNGEHETGTTVMLMDEEMDHGPILFQKIQTITPADTFLTLSSKLNQISAPLLLETIANYEAGKIQPKEQDHKEATYSKIFSKQDGRIDWRKPAQEIYNQYRALVPWPGVWTTWNGSMMKITDCGISTEKCTETPGTILPGGGVACGDKTVLSIKALQLQGKNPTDVESFLRGHRDFVGSTLE